ncbi:formylglycine-generating enzyme family protein [Aureispira anguillae]|uniref:Formylglycine-generating enzyme family protein n=1 Tax=Aureispira anguillae TaxID=2864201 RepID=A0A915YDW0_9BACT|nr:formylglycine-generating enzyme family protein [Aureispira anguillae]BDS11238.1 formylglycine-generating enzyme family protein [Aureispira anguillae]
MFKIAFALFTVLLISSCAKEEPIATSPELDIEFVTVPTDGTIASFEIAATEVSNEEYALFLNRAFAEDKITFDATTEKVYDLDGKELIYLGGSRVVKDHNSDGVYTLDEMENPLNICFIYFDETTQTFEIKDPATIDWDPYFDPNIYANVVDSKNDWYELSGNANGFYGAGDTDGLMPTLEEVKTWPANFVRYYGAEAFAKFYNCDLPTFTQWKLAGKGGQDFAYATADGTVNPSAAWYNVDATSPPFPIHKGHVQPVNSLSPNPLGVYNLGGNVWEWTKDWYRGTDVFSMGKQDEDYYIADEPEDPNHLKGLFGGSFNYFPMTMKITWNHAAKPNTGNDHFGFRVVKN